MISLRIGCRLLVVMAAASTVACSGAGGARLAVEADTLDIYGDDATQPRVHLIRPDGRTERVWHAKLRLSHDSAFRVVQDEFLRCLAPGEATVTLTKGSRSTQYVARCWPANLFGGTTFVDLLLGERPRAIALVAIDSAGHREPIRQFVASVGDSGVVKVRGRFFHPVGVGRATVVFHVGGAYFPASVTVREVIAHDSLRLAPGEFRAWPLAEGRYEITMRRAPGRAGFRAIEMTTEGAKCVRASGREETIHCLVRERGGVAVRNVAAAESGLEQRAVLWLVRVP